MVTSWETMLGVARVTAWGFRSGGRLCERKEDESRVRTITHAMSSGERPGMLTCRADLQQLLLSATATSPHAPVRKEVNPQVSRIRD